MSPVVGSKPGPGEEGICKLSGYITLAPGRPRTRGSSCRVSRMNAAGMSRGVWKVMLVRCQTRGQSPLYAVTASEFNLANPSNCSLAETRAACASPEAWDYQAKHQSPIGAAEPQRRTIIGRDPLGLFFWIS
jgi:hypothetical protein